ncbi:MAG: hypothetical protein ACRDAX_05155 [Propionibacteriaceae bacterium]
MTDIQNQTSKTTMEILENLRTMVAEARPVPMSASCMLNRAETLELIEEALAGLPQELDAANKVIEASQNEVLRGKDEGDRIRIEAEEWAAQMASQTEISRLAQKQADEMIAEATAEAEGIRTEADQYIDTRMAEFEAVLAKTSTQVHTMRTRLAERVPQAEDGNASEMPAL